MMVGQGDHREYHAALQAETGGANLEAELDDVAAWICTARSLLSGAKVPCERQVDALVEQFLGHVEAERILVVDLFGTLREEDFSQFRPRGHYTRSERLQRYFQAMMWVQRIGMDFVRYKRQAAVAYLLTEDLYDSGALEDWRLINGTIEALLGDSDSLNPEGMRQLAEAAGITSAGDLIDDEKHVARFSRDGKRIYYHELGLELEPEKEAGCSIAVMDADGGNRRRLTDGSKDYMFLSMSPWAEVQSFKARQQIERSRRERENEDRGRKD